MDALVWFISFLGTISSASTTFSHGPESTVRETRFHPGLASMHGLRHSAIFVKEEIVWDFSKIALFFLF